MTTVFANEGMHLVFVYGTLMQGERNHDRLAGARNVLVGKATLRGKYAMEDWRGFPALFRDAAADSDVAGEVYEVDTPTLLRRLDALEGHPQWYRRSLQRTKLEDGRDALAWVYIMRDDNGNRGERHHGVLDWRRIQANRRAIA